MITISREPAGFSEYLPVFATPDYLRARSGEWGWFRDDMFVLPFYVDRRFVFRRLVITHETIHLPGAEREREKEFLNRVVAAASSDLRIDFIAKSQANAVFRCVPEGSQETVGWGSYVTQLNGDRETLLKKIQPRTRTAIRKAARSGVDVEKIREAELVHGLLKETMDRQRQPYYPSRKFLQSLVEMDPGIAQFFVVRYRGAIQGCAVVFSNELGAYYYYGGSIERPFPGSIALLHYQIMLDLQERGVPFYDFMGARLTLEEGSKVLGIQRFKSHMATEMRRGYSFQFIVRPIRYRLFLMTAGLYLGIRGYSFPGDSIRAIRNVKHPVPAPLARSND